MGRYFLKCPSIGICWRFYLNGVIGLGKEDHSDRIPFSSHHIQGTCYQLDVDVDVDLSHPAEVGIVKSLHCKVILCPPTPHPTFPYCTLWRKVTVRSSYLRSRYLGSTSLRVEYLHKLLGIFLHVKFVSFHSF